MESTIDGRKAARAEIARMIWAYTESRIVSLAAKLRVPDLLSGAPKLPEEIAEELGVSQKTADRLVRAFEVCGLVDRGAGSRVQLTDRGQWLRSDVPESLYTIAIRTHDVYYPAWQGILEAVSEELTGFNVVFGSNYFEFINQHPEQGETFNSLMTSMCLKDAKRLVSVIDFSTVDYVVDVGGGDGTLLCEVLKANRHLHGAVFDSDSVRRRAVEKCSSAGISERCTVISGDFRVSVPSGGDLYILKHVLHNWPDEDCIRILQNCRTAMQKNGRLLIIERVVDSWSPSDVRSDLHMWILMNGAERTKRDFVGLLGEGGFQCVDQVTARSMPSIITAMPLSSGVLVQKSST